MNRNILLGLLCTLSAGVAAQATDRPNVIVFIADDVSWNDYGCYGNAAARTPNIDELARNGIRFDEAYLTASSCSPSRSSIITGRYPHNNGKAAELHLAIDGELPWFPTLLREAGYYTAIVGKHHMKAAPGGSHSNDTPFDLVDSGNVPGNRGGHGKWVQTVKQRPKDKPFFFWFASYDAHRDWDGDKDWNADQYGPKHRPSGVTVPPFLADDQGTRDDLASYYNEVTRFDHYIGEVVQALKEEKQLDNTLIFVLADNGRPFPRAKTRLHDSGMKTALIANWPAGIARGGVATTSLTSVIDLAPTILEVAGVSTTETMQGVSLKPVLDDPSVRVRRYAFSEHNWHDYEAHGRSVRADGFLYIRNNRPYQPWQGPADSVRSVSHQQLLALRNSNKLTEAQADVFLAPRPEEELYQSRKDPYQLNNLANDPAFAETKQRLSNLLDQWVEETGDSVPADISRDSFHRETGDRTVKKEADYRGTTPGENRGATKINAAGPR
ncbi:MAG: sulfatase [Planctomycetaceae bacterium]|nr:sulfatase [Planctomycetales bacterium]MCB9921153.1 sulfatase [Planctomycetaceae bacterium]